MWNVAVMSVLMCVQYYGIWVAATCVLWNGCSAFTLEVGTNYAHNRLFYGDVL